MADVPLQYYDRETELQMAIATNDCLTAEHPRIIHDHHDAWLKDADKFALPSNLSSYIAIYSAWVIA